ncbi:MAG TPA: GntR family transcriptional regulator [[Clostridium] spiroforme]|uniref:GntR family transcriptional regulator n=1 Tax=Thomasclavelia spiroformis TaxID=29348 RepID=A0A921GB40_9FIRM|nr:GntR family transcriptional regulator [Thomasclavelia spiroformis]
MASELLKKIVSERYPVGKKLPSIRQLAKIYHVSNNTVVKALQYLETQDIINNFRTNSYVVIKDSSQIQKNVITKEIINFLENMKNLGFEKEEILLLVSEYTKQCSH